MSNHIDSRVSDVSNLIYVDPCGAARCFALPIQNAPYCSSPIELRLSLADFASAVALMSAG
jgi:hypothetical protein